MVKTGGGSGAAGGKASSNSVHGPLWTREGDQGCRVSRVCVCVLCVCAARGKGRVCLSLERERGQRGLQTTFAVAR